MKLTYYLDRVDQIIMSAIKRGLISSKEGFIMQCMAYEYDNYILGLNWLTKRLDQLESDRG